MPCSVCVVTPCVVGGSRLLNLGISSPAPGPLLGCRRPFSRAVHFVAQDIQADLLKDLQALSMGDQHSFLPSASAPHEQLALSASPLSADVAGAHCPHRRKREMTFLAAFAAHYLSSASLDSPVCPCVRSDVRVVCCDSRPCSVLITKRLETSQATIFKDCHA
jgi:hypothetical protein